METLKIHRFEGQTFSVVEELLVPESRLTVFLNEKELVQLLALPANVEELVLGFLLSECLIQGPDEVTDIQFNQRSMAVSVRVSEETAAHFSDPVRTITTGCGKGVTFITKTWEKFFPLLDSAETVLPEHIIASMKELQRVSDLFRETGGVHSAALAEGGTILKAFDDIGRHNAVDKILGYLLKSHWPVFGAKTLLTTGRISSEIVTKTARGRIPVLVSHSAPTYGAVQIAEKLGMTLIGFARGSRFNVYSHPERIVGL